MYHWFECPRPNCGWATENPPNNGRDLYHCPECGTKTRLLVHEGERRVLTAHQPNFLAWLGVFEKLFVGDVFVVMDDVDYSTKGFQNRCRLLAPNHKQVWATVPLDGSGRDCRINTATPVHDFSISLLDKLDGWGYTQSSFGESVASFLQSFDGKRVPGSLAHLNTRLIEIALVYLGQPRAKVVNASMFNVRTTKTQRLIDYCLRTDCNVLWSGSGGARTYLDVQLCNEHGIEVQWQNFRHPRYTQVNGRPHGGVFVPGLGVLDALSSPNFDVQGFLDRCNAIHEESHTWGDRHPNAPTSPRSSTGSRRPST